MSKTMTDGRMRAVPVVDRLFAGGCTAIFLLLVGGVIQVVHLYLG